LFNFADESMINYIFERSFFELGEEPHPPHPPCLSIMGKCHKTWKYNFLKNFKKGKEYDHPYDMEEVRKGNNNTK